MGLLRQNLICLIKIIPLGLKPTATDIFIRISMPINTDVITEGVLSLRYDIQIYDLFYTELSVCLLRVNEGLSSLTSALNTIILLYKHAVS